MFNFLHLVFFVLRIWILSTMSFLYGIYIFFLWIANLVYKAIPHTVLSVRRAPQNWCSSLWYGTRLPLGQQGAKQRINSSAQHCCSSLSQRQSRPIPKQGAEISCAVNFLCCSSLFQRQSCPIPKRGESVPLSPSLARNGHEGPP